MVSQKVREEHLKGKQEINSVIYCRVVKKNNIENSPSVSAKINVSDLEKSSLNEMLGTGCGLRNESKIKRSKERLSFWKSGCEWAERNTA